MSITIRSPSARTRPVTVVTAPFAGSWVSSSKGTPQRLWRT